MKSEQICKIIGDGFFLRDRVFLKCNTEYEPGFITGIMIRDNNFLYEVSFGGGSISWRLAFELTKEFDNTKSIIEGGS